MDTLDLIAKQLKRETSAQTEARQRLITRLQAANDRSYASSNIDSQALIRKHLAQISSCIKQRYHHLTSGPAGMDYELIVRHLKNTEPEVLALITMKVCFDVIGKEKAPRVQQITTQIGKTIQTDCKLTYFANENPDLYKRCEQYFHHSTGTRQKATIFTRAFNKADTEWERWSNTANHRIGVWLLRILMETTGWIVNDYIYETPQRKRSVVRYSNEFIGMREAILQQAEELAFCAWPMLCPPVDWTNEFNGGYLTESVRQTHGLIKRRPLKGPLIQGDIPLAMLNNLQHTSYRINPLVYEVIDNYYTNHISVGKFIRDEHLEPPPSVGDNPTKEELKAYKIERRKREDFNAQLSQRNWRSTELLYVARKYKDDVFWMASNFDYRGRIYFLNSVLSPQGTDPEKSLLYFNEEGKANEYWLLWHIATTHSQDKETHNNRVKWAKKNIDLVKRVAIDPIHNHEWWEADEPWCFLAACLEWYNIYVLKTKTTSGLPIGIDATQSGIQHLSALTLDGDSAALVNVTPTSTPADGYLSVAEKAKDYLDKRFHPWMNRKVTKRVVMCCPYGVTLSSSRGYIREALIEDGHREDIREAGVLTTITKAIFNQAVPAVFAGPVRVMAWLQQSASEIMRNHETIEWVSPSGFRVVQDLRETNTIEVKTRLMGSTRMKLQIADGYLGPDTGHHRTALAPNVVHSMDAALLHLTFAYWDRPFTCIHDCVLGRSCDINAMGKEIRLHFAEMYKAPVLEDWASQVGVEIPDDLIKNTLDMEEVNKSKYFFS